MKSRLLIIEALATLGGGQRLLLNLLPALQTAFQVRVIVPAEGPLTTALHALEVSTLILPMGERFSLQRKTGRDVVQFALHTPRLIAACARQMRTTSTEVVLLNATPTFPWGTLGAGLARTPVVWFSHNRLVDGKTLGLVRLLAHAPWVRRILAVSESAGAQFQAPAKTQLLPHGVDTTRFQPDPAARARIRAQYGWAATTPVVALVGDFLPLKRQHLALAAVQRARAQCPELQLVFIGGPRATEADSVAYHAEITQSARPLPGIFLVGPQTNIPAWLNAVDALIVASTTETGPLVLLEALACGTPVFSTPVGQAPALLGDGACGALFAHDDAAALAQTLNTWWQAPARATLGTQGRQRILASWTLAQMQARLVAALQACL